MQKKQKIAKKKKSQKAYKDFIHIVKWFKDDFILASYISNIYDDNDKKEVEVYRLPIWRDVSDIQRLAYFFYFMAETKEFTCLKPFTSIKMCASPNHHIKEVFLFLLIIQMTTLRLREVK